MKNECHRIPIINHEGRNLEEKESRHDLDTKLSEIRDIRNNNFKGLKSKI